MLRRYGCVFILLLLLAGCVSATAGAEWIKVSDQGLFPGRSGHTSVVYDGKMWVIGGTGVSNYGQTLLNDTWYSTDGKTWAQATEHAAFPARNGHTSVVYDGKMWVIGGSDGKGSLNDIWYSTDGKTWTQATEHAAFPARNGHTSVVYDGKMWVIGGVNNHRSDNWTLFNDVWSSTDGKTWIQATEHAGFLARSGHTSVVYDGKMWVIYGNGVDGRTASNLWDVWSSTDGKTWIQVSSKYHGRFGLVGLTSVVFDNKIWVFGMERVKWYDHDFATNEVWYSTDGANWTQVNKTSFPLPELPGHTSVVYNERIWAIGGSLLNDVWCSTDGKIWIQANDPPNLRHFFSATVEYDNKLWVIGGGGVVSNYDLPFLNDTYYSTDGKTWIQATEHAAFPVRGGHTSVVYDGKMWVIGGWGVTNYGPLNDTWYSTDGKTWTQATEHAAFPARNCHTSVVYDEKMWVIGGWGLSNYGPLNDTWYSTDGKTWTQATEHAAFPARNWHTSVVYDGKMWVIGGTGISNYLENVLNDTWYSTDGKTWTKVTGSAGFPGCYLHTTVVYDGKMWVIGGFDPNKRFFNDVWYMNASSINETSSSSSLQSILPTAIFFIRSIVHSATIFILFSLALAFLAAAGIVLYRRYRLKR